MDEGKLVVAHEAKRNLAVPAQQVSLVLPTPHVDESPLPDARDPVFSERIHESGDQRADGMSTGELTASEKDEP